MSHFKCLPCRTRLRVSAPVPASVPDLCPRCGSLLEPVSDLAEVIGFWPITSVDGATVDPSGSPQEQLAQRISDLVTHRTRRQARRSLGKDCTASFDEPAGVAVAVTRPYPAR